MRQILWEFLFSIEKNILFSSVKKGFMVTFPMVLMGTAALLLNSIFLPLLQSMFPDLNTEVFGSICVLIHGATVGCLSLYLCIAVGFYYALARNIHNVLIRLMAILTGVICFIILVGGISSDYFQSYMGVIGVLPAIVVELTAISIFLKLTNLISHSNQAASLGVDDNLKVSAVSILPLFITVCGCVVLQYVAVTFLHVGDLYETLSAFFHLLFNEGAHPLLNGILFTLSVHFLWILGIHGGNVMDPISVELLVPMNTDSTAIISKSFLDVFSLIGGSGTTICLFLAILIGSRAKATRDIARTSAPMILFNINELLVFGLPIMFNPLMVIPFVLVPIVSLVIAYVATLLGLIPIVNGTIHWATPVFYSGYLATGSISGILVQLVIIICGTAIYLPFVKLLDKFQAEKEIRILNELISTFRTNESAGVHKPMLNRTDALGQTARTVAHQLHLDISANKVNLFYQPQVNDSGTVVGAEALLRWTYQGQFLYPPFVIALAQEDGILNQLTLHSAETICNTILEANETAKKPIHISMNMAASQFDDIHLINDIIEIVHRTNTRHRFHLELTEETSLNGFPNISANIRHLRANGIVVAIDDFGMGQTSINYLKEHTFEYVKIDGSLVRQILTNPRCSQIVASVIELGHSLQYDVIAEYVDRAEIRDKLMEMDCHLFQGYYFSPALPKDEFFQYCGLTTKEDPLKST